MVAKTSDSEHPRHSKLPPNRSAPSDDVVSSLGEPAFGVLRNFGPLADVIEDGWVLHDVPDILSSVAELAASNTGRQREVADRNLLVHHGVGKVILTLGHSTDEDADAVLGIHRLDILTNLDQWRIETQSNLAAVGRQVVGDGVLDHPEQLLVRVGGADRQAVQKLNHETGEALECSGNTD